MDLANCNSRQAFNGDRAFDGYTCGDFDGMSEEGLKRRNQGGKETDKEYIELEVV